MQNNNISQPKNLSWKQTTALFLTSQNISLFGSSVVGFAIIWHITLETSSGTWMMLASICAFIPQVIISLWGGVWADRYNRKYIIMIADGGIALATLALAITFFMGYQKLELILGALIIRSIGAGIQMPAVNAIFPQIVPKNKLTKVNGINQTLNSLFYLLAPPAGGVVLGSFGLSWAFMVDVITALIAIAVLWFIKIEKVVKTTAPETVFNDLKEGLSFAFNNKLIKSIIICYAAAFFLITPASFLTPIMIERLFGNDVWKLTLNEVVWTIGTLLGGLYITLRGRFNNKIHAISIALGGFGVTFALLGVAKTFVVYLVIMGASGFFLPIMTTAQTVLIQENVKGEMMGRVFSIIQIITGATMPIAMLLFGPLADAVSIGNILVVTGILLAFVGVAFSKVKNPPPLPVEAGEEPAV